jgi:hypothetical protein
MLKMPGTQISETILPLIPPPMPARTVPARTVPARTVPVLGLVPREPTKAKGLPTKIWKDTRGFHRKPKANANVNANVNVNAIVMKVTDVS